LLGVVLRSLSCRLWNVAIVYLRGPTDVLQEAEVKKSYIAALSADEQLALTCQNALLFGATALHRASGDTANTTEGPATSAEHTSTQTTQDATTVVQLTTHSRVDADADQAGPGIFHGQHPSLLALHALRRELTEVRDIVTRLFADHCITVELTPPSAALTAGKSSKSAPTTGKTQFIPITNEDFKVDLHYTKIRPVAFVRCEKDYEVWRYHYPSWMQPVVHFGHRAPSETFYRRLQYELRTGKDGVYTRINKRDNRIDAAGRCLLRFLKQTVVLRGFVRRQAAQAYAHSVDQLFMQWEDTLAAAVRADAEARRVEEERRKSEHRSCFGRFLSCFQRATVFQRSARVVHSLGTDDDNLTDLNAAQGASARSSNRGGGFSWGFKPKYAKITIFSSEDEMRAALKASLEAKLPVQAYPIAQQRPLECAIMAGMRTVGNLLGAVSFDSERVGSEEGERRLQALVEQYAFLESVAAVRDVITASIEARDTITQRTHYRSMSWVTGQAVHLNARGEHVETVQYSLEALQGAAALYGEIGAVVDQVCLMSDADGTKAAAAVQFPSHAKVSPKSGAATAHSTPHGAKHTQHTANTKAEPTADRMRVQPDYMASLTSAVSPVQELYFGGGLRHLVTVARVVECAAVNPRGVATTHSLLLPHLEPPLPSVAQFEGMLSEAESMRLMQKQLASKPGKAGTHSAVKGRRSSLHNHKDHSLTGAGRTAKSPAAGKRAPKTTQEASHTIAQFIRKRSIGAKLGEGSAKVASTSGKQSSVGEADSVVSDTASLEDTGLSTKSANYEVGGSTKSIVSTGPSTRSAITAGTSTKSAKFSASSKSNQTDDDTLTEVSTEAAAADAGTAGVVVVGPAPSSDSSSRASASSKQQPVKRSSLRGSKSSFSRRGSAEARSNNPPKRVSISTPTVAEEGKSKETAMETIAKFLRSKAFNVTVNKRGKKFNYNGSKLRTEVHLPKAVRSEIAGKKIARFLRAKSRGKLDTGENGDSGAVVSQGAKVKAADIEAALALQQEQERDRSAMYCNTLFDLFTSARAGFADRILCQDRLWQFATVVTHRKRALCDLSVRSLRSERVVKPLPTLRDLQSILVLAIFRDRYLRFATSVATIKAPTGGAAGGKGTRAARAVPHYMHATGQNNAAGADPHHAHGQHHITRRRKCVEVLQGLCKIYHAKKLLRQKRLHKRQATGGKK
jgi:hypothetical protein